MMTIMVKMILMTTMMTVMTIMIIMSMALTTNLILNDLAATVVLGSLPLQPAMIIMIFVIWRIKMIPPINFNKD